MKSHLLIVYKLLKFTIINKITVVVWYRAVNFSFIQRKATNKKSSERK